MLNHVNIMGRLTRDPELRRTESGIAVCSFSIACDRDYSGKGSEKETDFFDIVAWRNTAEFISNYFTKGRMIVLSGRLQTRTWTDKEGNKRKVTEVVAESCYFGDSKPQEGGSYQTPGNYQNPANNYGQPQNPAPNYGQQQQMGGFGGQNHSGGNYGGNQYGTYNPPAANAPGDYDLLYGDDEKLPF